MYMYVCIYIYIYIYIYIRDLQSTFQQTLEHLHKTKWLTKRWIKYKQKEYFNITRCKV